MEEEFSEKPPLVLAKELFNGWHFKPLKSQKPQQYYENILVQTGLVLFKHYTDPKYPNFITHSTAQILKILQPRDWSENPNSIKKFPAKFTTKIDHRQYFTYWDYQMAWYNAFLMNNQHMRHSCLIYFKYGTQFKFPNWTIYFFSKLCISWIVSWNYSYEQDQYTGIPLLFNDEKYDLKYLDNFFNKNPRLCKSVAPDQTTTKFFQAKSTASAMLAQAKTKKEYKKLMAEMLSSLDFEFEDEKSS
uniref:Uncharacterized protein n=1 Tax=Gossypium raimondii TaxID=29730 RepID=A0A0D2QMC7_GOSRA|nr:hypothetical protein B456_001G087700 [Gossypium raimondii]